MLGGANNTAGHADSRAMVFDAGNNILEGNDGGIVRLVNPTVPAARAWQSLNGDLKVTEFYGVSYDNVNDVIFGGTQDTGSTEQSGSNSPTWNQVNQGDGGLTGVANVGIASVRYTVGNNLQNGTFVRRIFDNSNNLVVSTNLGLNGLVAADQNFKGFTTFPLAINTVNPARLLLGGLNVLYESTDQGDNLANVTPAGQSGVTAFAYGGVLGGVGNADVAYVAFGGNLFLRSTSGGAFNQLTAYTGGGVTDIVLDPDNWQRAYVLSGNGVFFTPDGGATFNPLTGNLGALATVFNSISIYSPGTAAGDEVVVVGALGGVFRTLNPLAGNNALWMEYGGGMPNVQVTEVFYDAVADVLLAGTYGRGAWEVNNASATLPVPGVLQIDGDTLFPGQDDVIRLVRDANNPPILNVFVNNLSVQPDFTVRRPRSRRSTSTALGGNDTLIVDSSNGLITVPSGVRYDGGTAPGQSGRLGGFDTLRSTRPAAPPRPPTRSPSGSSARAAAPSSARPAPRPSTSSTWSRSSTPSSRRPSPSPARPASPASSRRTTPSPTRSASCWRTPAASRRTPSSRSSSPTRPPSPSTPGPAPTR